MNKSVDVWNYDTWELLTDIRAQLRDDIFDCACNDRLQALENDLAHVEREIAQGQVRAYPF